MTDILPSISGDNGPVEATPVILFGPQGQEMAAVDGAASGLVTICMMHRQIHLGQIWEASKIIQALADDASSDVLIRTPAGVSSHISMSASCGGDAYVELYEGATVSADGTALAPINRNRQSEETNSTLLFTGPTVSDAGAKLWEGFLPGGSGNRSVGGIMSCLDEFIMKPDEDYLIRLTNKSGAAKSASFSITFYERSIE